MCFWYYHGDKCDEGDNEIMKTLTQNDQWHVECRMKCDYATHFNKVSVVDCNYCN